MICFNIIGILIFNSFKLFMFNFYKIVQDFFTHILLCKICLYEIYLLKGVIQLLLKYKKKTN